MTREQSLLALHTAWASKNSCALKKTATRAVFGDGNPNAKIVFIGEAPGKKEDLGGKPFIGAAGKFLREMLESIHMKREDIYITNIVKYRPPNNRDPLPEEIAACQEWLHEELSYIKPKLVIFLGRHSMNHFFPTETISLVHGKLLTKDFEGIPTKYFLPLYHPAAALYNGGLRTVLLSDFKKIPSILKNISSKK